MKATHILLHHHLYIYIYIYKTQLKTGVSKRPVAAVGLKAGRMNGFGLYRAPQPASAEQSAPIELYRFRRSGRNVTSASTQRKLIDRTRLNQQTRGKQENQAHWNELHYLCRQDEDHSQEQRYCLRHSCRICHYSHTHD